MIGDLSYHYFISIKGEQLVMSPGKVPLIKLYKRAWRISPSCHFKLTDHMRERLDDSCSLSD